MSDKHNKRITITDNKHAQQFAKSAAESADSFKSISSSLQQIASKLADSDKFENNALFNMKSKVDSIQDFIDLQSESIRLDKDKTRLTKLLGIAEEERKLLSGEQLLLADKYISNLKKQQKTLDKQLSIVKFKESVGAKILKDDEATLLLERKRLKIETKIKDVSEEIGHLASGPISMLQSALEHVPGGSLLGKALGLETLGKDVEHSISSAMQKSLSKKFPKLLGQSAPVVNAAGEAATSVVDAGSGEGGLVATMGEFLPALSAAAVAIGGIVIALGFLVKRISHVRDNVIDISRHQGVTTDEAYKMHEHMLHIVKDTQSIAGNMSVIGLNEERWKEIQYKFSDVLQTNNLLSAEAVKNAAYLMNQYELSVDEATDLNSITALSNTSAAAYTEQLKNSVASFNQMTGQGLRVNDIMKSISKVSKTTWAYLKGNVEQLKFAVIESKALGFELDRTRDITDGLLDIESSIESEMEARVLTGRNMNLNNARALALQGKSVEAMEELARQAGGYDSIMSMQPYQLKSMAKALNMSSDELVNMATRTKILSKLTNVRMEDLSKLTSAQIDSYKLQNKITDTEAEQLRASAQQAKASEMASSAMAKLGAALDSFMDGPFMELLMGGREYKQKLYDAGLSSEKPKTTGQLVGQMAMNNSGKIAGLINPMAGAYIAAANYVNDEFINKPVETGHDATINNKGLIVKHPRGTVQLDKDDSIVAGTSISSTNNSSNNSEVVSLLKQLISSVNQPVQISLGNRVIQELDSTLSLRKNYTFGIDNTYGNMF